MVPLSLYVWVTFFTVVFVGANTLAITSLVKLLDKDEFEQTGLTRFKTESDLIGAVVASSFALICTIAGFMAVLEKTLG